MKRSIFKLMITFLLVCASTASTHAQPSDLDGKSYAITLEQKSGKSSTWQNDTFIFVSGQMYSVRMKKQEGFKKASYSPTTQGQVTKFTYDATNKGGSTLKIEGSVEDTRIEGTITWTSLQGEHIYIFKGTLIQ